MHSNIFCERVIVITSSSVILLVSLGFRKQIIFTDIDLKIKSLDFFGRSKEKSKNIRTHPTFPAHVIYNSAWLFQF